MKKIALFALAISTLAGGMMLASNASSLKYHRMMYNNPSRNLSVAQTQKNLQLRPYTDGYARATQAIAGNMSRAQYYQYRNSRSMVPEVKTHNPELPLRTMIADYRQIHPYQRHRFGSNEYNAGLASTYSKPLFTYENDIFSLQLPPQFLIDMEGEDYLFSDVDSTLMVKVSQVEDICNTISFTVCAENFSRVLNRENQPHEIHNPRVLHRVSRKSEQNVLENGHSVETYVQSFTTRVRMKDGTTEDMFIARYFVPNTLDQIHVIETQIKISEARENIDLIRKIFGSFQAFDAEKIQERAEEIKYLDLKQEETTVPQE